MDLEFCAIGLVSGRSIGVAGSKADDERMLQTNGHERLSTHYLACRKQAMLEHLVDGTHRLDDWDATDTKAVW